MFEYIKGIATIKNTNYIVLENQNIGYKIFTSFATISECKLKEEMLLYTYLHVREDTMLIYGFSDVEELHLFHLLIGISGIGPKAAITMLSALSYQEIASAIVAEDVKLLTTAPGVGKKTAMRIILELKDKLKADFSEQLITSSEIVTDNNYSEAVNALIVLGYSSADAKQIVNNVYKQGDSVQDLIKKSLSYQHGK